MSTLIIIEIIELVFLCVLTYFIVNLLSQIGLFREIIDDHFDLINKKINKYPNRLPGKIYYLVNKFSSSENIEAADRIFSLIEDKDSIVEGYLREKDYLEKQFLSKDSDEDHRKLIKGLMLDNKKNYLERIREIEEEITELDPEEVSSLLRSNKYK